MSTTSTAQSASSFAHSRVQLGVTELRVSPICLGSMTWGQQNTEVEGHAQIDLALASGVNFIDTAEMYSVPVRAETYGATERIIGSWLAKNKPKRDQIVLATKVAGPSRNPSDVQWVRGDALPLSRADIDRAVKGSLQRLQTDYIDLYQVHWPARNVPMFGGQFFEPSQERESSAAIEETLGALNDMVKAGLIRAIGVSNETPWGVAEWLRLSRDRTYARIATIQNAYNLMNRVYEHGLAEQCYRDRVSLLAYSPLAFGHLAGKYLNGTQSGPDGSRMRLFPQFGPRYGKPNVVPAANAYAALAKRYGLTLTQLALAFCRAKQIVTSTIIGATSVAQLQENIAAFDVSLSAEQLTDIDQLHFQYSNPAP
jgi:aryl-alcohol dehydrogenase-like predicted oxidoreductase